MATMNALIDRARLELGDRGAPLVSTAVADGSAVRFELAARPVAENLQVSLIPAGGNPTLLAPGADYQLDAANGIVTLTSPPTAGTTVYSVGTAYPYFSDLDWTTFVNTSFLQHNHGRSQNLAKLDPVEDYLVVLLAVCEALYALMNDSAFDIDIATPEGISIPRHQRFDQLMQMLLARQDQYQRLASALNVGLNRIEMFTLRRVSRSTGRLVPIYVEQEVGEATPPRRVFVPIDQNGAHMVEDPIETYDITFEVGVPFELDVTLNAPIPSGTVVRAQLRKHELGGPLIYFTTEVVDATLGVVKILMQDTSRTRLYFNGDAAWDLRLTDTSGITRTFLKGKVEVIERPYL